MFCMRCGAKLPNEAKFCFSCGAPVNSTKRTTQPINRVQLKCKSCNGVMDIDEDRPILKCSFCGSKEIILEGDKVAIQRIKSKAYKDVELGKQQTFKEVELGKKELEIKGDNNKFKRILICFLIILVGAIITYWSLQNVSLGGTLVGIITIVAGIITLRHSSGDKSKKEDYLTHSSKSGHATWEDIEMAKIRSEEKQDRNVWIFLAMLFGLMYIGIPILSKLLGY